MFKFETPPDRLHGRALHFILRILDRKMISKFYVLVLGMKVLRHEEFPDGCITQCNGRFENPWSLTMVGYGSEDDHFAMELNYNYNVSSYALGNDFLGITIKSREAIERAKAANWPIFQEDGINVVKAPGGYKFFLLDEPQPTDKDPVQKITLASSNLEETVKYWNDTIGMRIHARDDKSILFGYEQNQTKVEFKDIGQKVEHKTGYGRTAFSLPQMEILLVDAAIRKSVNYTIHTPFINIDTPGRPSITVEVLPDPDGHELCFFDDENYRNLSKIQLNATAELDKYIRLDELNKKATA